MSKDEHVKTILGIKAQIYRISAEMIKEGTMTDELDIDFTAIAISLNHIKQALK